jgi:hypothetical protein
LLAVAFRLAFVVVMGVTALNYFGTTHLLQASGVTLKPATHGRLKTGHALIPDRCCFTPPM